VPDPSNPLSLQQSQRLFRAATRRWLNASCAPITCFAGRRVGLTAIVAIDNPLSPTPPKSAPVTLYACRLPFNPPADNTSCCAILPQRNHTCTYRSSIVP